MAKLIVIATSLSFEICTFYSLSWTNCTSISLYGKVSFEALRVLLARATKRSRVLQVQSSMDSFLYLAARICLSSISFKNSV